MEAGVKVPGKVVVRIRGGLGNQLFCYAAGRRLAFVNHSELVIDDVSGFSRDYHGRRYELDSVGIPCRKATAWERMEPGERIRRGIAKKWASCRPFGQRRYIYQEGREFDGRLLKYEVGRRTVCLDGLWQSESYFADVGSIIRDDLRSSRGYDNATSDIETHIESVDAVGVHVRFFDSPACAASRNNLKVSYYNNAMELIERNVKKPKYFVFSNEPEAARTLVAKTDRVLEIVGRTNGDTSAYKALRLMSKCKHFIVANSTFSWWAAWLAIGTEKCIVAPGRLDGSITSWGFEGLIPSTWWIVELDWKDRAPS